MEKIMDSKSTIREKKKGVFQKGSIILGGFLGGLFVACWMVGENFRELDRPVLAKNFKIIGAISFILTLVVAYFYADSSVAAFSVGAIILAYMAFEHQKEEV